MLLNYDTRGLTLSYACKLLSRHSGWFDADNKVLVLEGVDF